jgi:hypothetical protein
VDWNNECTLVGYGVSVLKRSCMGATQALEALRAIEVEKLERAKRAQSERFPGAGLSVSNTAQGEYPAPATVTDAPSPVNAGNVIVPPQHYPGVRLDEVVVPFMLNGRVNLKTGHAFVEKTHHDLVFNSITYKGKLLVIGVGPDGREHDLGIAALRALVDPDSVPAHQGSKPRVQAIRFELKARWSRASLAVIFNADMPEDVVQVGADASAASASGSQHAKQGADDESRAVTPRAMLPPHDSPDSQREPRFPSPVSQMSLCQPRAPPVLMRQLINSNPPGRRRARSE